MKVAERIRTLARMEKSNLDIENTKTSAMPALQAACERADALGMSNYFAFHKNLKLQHAFINDCRFSELYASLVAENISDTTIEKWLEMAEEYCESLYIYTRSQLIDAAGLAELGAMGQYDYLKFYAPFIHDQKEKETALKSLIHYNRQTVTRLSELSAAQRKLLMEPYFHEYLILPDENAGEMLSLLEGNRALRDILSLLHSVKAECALDIKDVENLQWLKEEDVGTFVCAMKMLGDDTHYLEQFLERWFENGASSYDLAWIAGQSEPLSEKCKKEMLSTRIGYLSSLYSGKLKIPFESLHPYQVDVLLYAIENKKNHFLKLVSDNFESFLNLDYRAMLFDEAFYKRCNLNALSVKNIKESRSEENKYSRLSLLENKEYTFEELKILRYAKEPYIEVYKRLNLPRVDTRLIIIRQLLKKELLPQEITEMQIEQLAKCFSIKPLNLWREQDFSHIQGLNSRDLIRFLMEYDKISKFLPDLQTWEDLAFAARSADRIVQYARWEDVREAQMTTDQDWNTLISEMSLSNEFIVQNRQHILRFLMKEGAEMTRLYYDFTKRKEAFRRIVQAELMGEFHKLKYFGDDLRKEINYPINEMQKKVWTDNESLDDHHFRVYEADDYYTTLRIGVLPHKTCLSYISGMYRDCLLACFDSNKKILLATKNGAVVGRAVMRLTKGAFQAMNGVTNGTGEASLEFADLLDKDDVLPAPEEKKEWLTLFLEVPYFTQVSDQEKMAIQQMFVRLATEKAQKLGAVSVLASKYYESYAEGEYVRMGFYLYISRSKGGVQYLDSLSGSTTVSQEDSYQKNIFLVRKTDLDQ